MDGAEYRFDPDQTLLEVARELAAATGWQLIEPDSTYGGFRLQWKRPGRWPDPDLP